MPSSLLTFRYRVKDSTSGKHLLRMAWAVNTVWNYCQEVSLLALQREKRWLTAFDLITLCAGASTDLGISSETIAEVCREYVTRRRQFRARRLRWRSRKRSLGWIPLKMRFLKVTGDTIRYQKRCFRFWCSRPIQGTPKTGSFSQDARGRWYLNIQCEVDAHGVPLGSAEIGIDLGLINQVTCSDQPKPNRRDNLTQRYAEPLAKAQRAHKANRVKAIHAKIANARRDWTHKLSTSLVNRAQLIVVGNVSSAKLVKTRFAKSVYDASWSDFKAQLVYKAMRLGVRYVEVNEAWSSVTCSACLQKTGPSGLGDLGVRVWQCSHCGTCHNRDNNAAVNILRLGREALSRESPDF
jgi:putative transposase